MTKHPEVAEGAVNFGGRIRMKWRKPLVEFAWGRRKASLGKGKHQLHK